MKNTNIVYTNSIKQLSAALLTLLILPLTVTAANKTVSSGSVVESGSSYSDLYSPAALEVYNPGSSYTGTGITLSASSNYAYGAYAHDQGALALTGGSITTTGNSGYGIFLNGSSSGRGENVVINTAGTSAYGAFATNSSTLALTGGTVTTGGLYGNAILLYGNSSGRLENVTVGTAGVSSHGVLVDGTSTLTLTGGAITTSESSGFGVYLSNYSSGTVEDVVVNTAGDNSFGVYLNSFSALTATNTVISTTGNNAHGIYAGGSSSAVFDGLQVTTSGSNAAALFAWGDSYVNLGTNVRLEAAGPGGEGAGALGALSGATVEGVGAEIISAQGGAVRVAGSSTLALTDSRLQGIHGIIVAYQGTGTSVVDISGGTVDAANNAVYVQPNAAGSASDENAVINISGATITSGTLVNNNETWNSGTLTVNFNQSDLTNAGGIIVGDGNNSVTTVNVNGGSGIHGDVSNSGSGTLNVNLDHSSLTGNITGSGNARLEVTITGPGSALHGDVAANGASVISLTIGADALFDGGGTLSSLTLESGAILGFDGGLLVTGGTITVAGGILVDFGALTETGGYVVIDWSGATESGSVTADQFSVAGTGVEGAFAVQNGQLVFTASAVPEPSACFLLGIGLGLTGLMLWRRHKAMLSLPE
ncbi:MAG: PEP-CTERM sorting domain-containing protein [Verrucomicrobiales bacterium]|jgi:autotransporter family porin|nr:PEP-CTERM sorting domain-containing protein [Verrucomicrobiales bacterium]